LLLNTENKQKTSPVVKVLKSINPFKKGQWKEGI
jgi:hypothetical protein